MNIFKAIRIGAAFLFGAGALLSGGCAKDVDPHEKIDAPGYYNGPMKGQVKGGPSKGNQTPPPAAKGDGGGAIN